MPRVGEEVNYQVLDFEAEPGTPWIGRRSLHSHMIPRQGPRPSRLLLSAKSGILVLDRNVTASHALVLASEKVGDLLVFGLLDGALVVLGPSTHELLLDHVDACVGGRGRGRGSRVHVSG